MIRKVSILGLAIALIFITLQVPIAAVWPYYVVKADFDQSGFVNLGDAILALQMQSDIDPTSIIQKDASLNGATIGIENAIYILQLISGIRHHRITYTAEANGSISGDSNQQIENGSYGTSVTAVPDAGCLFVKWSDGSTDNPRTDTNVAASMTLTAQFALIEKTLKETTLNVATASATVTVPEEGITLEIPQGIAESDFSLSVTTAYNAPETPLEIEALKVFNVHFSVDPQFGIPLKIRINFNPEDITVEKVADNFSPILYDTVRGQWALLSDYTINFDENYIEFETAQLFMEEWEQKLPYESRSVTASVSEFFGGIVGWGIKKQTSGLLDIYNKTPFTAQPGFRVYWTFQPPHTAMSNWEYEQTGQPWHLDVEPEDPNWAPRYVQDVAYFLSKAKETFQNNGLTVPDDTVNVFVRNIGADGQYGSVSGSIYINNKVQGQASLTHPQELRAVCAHEFMHLVQDYEYVMNKGTIGLWWLEALATQADGMVWQDSPFTESELWITDNNNAFLQTLSKSWDDCGVDPNYYLAGCFLQYLSKYRGGGAINVADLVTAGGAYGSTFSSHVEVLDSEIQKRLDSNIGMEFSNYVEYLFMAGNPKLKAIPDGNGFLSMETAQSFVKTTRIIDGSLKVERSSSISTIGTEQTVSASLPYLSAQLINVVNHDLRYRRVEYTLSKSDFSFGHILARINSSSGKLEEIRKLYSDDSGYLILDARSGAVKDRFVVLLVNPYTTGENKNIELGLQVTEGVSVNIEEGDIEKEMSSTDTSFTQILTAVASFEGDYLFKWDFGDGSFTEESITGGDQSQVTHTYENVEPGDSIDVQVTVYTPDGKILLGNDTVTITTLPLYRVTYDGNGNDEGTVPVDTQGYLEGEVVTILGNSGNLSGPYKTFAGWNRESDGSGTSYAAGAQFEMGDDDVTLYAQYYTDSECFEIDEDGTITGFTYYPDHGKDVIIPPNLNIKRIGDGAFYGQELRSITIPEGVVSIGKNAFGGNALVYVKIPDSCTSIGDYGLHGLNYWDEVAPLTIVIGSDVVFGFDEGGFKTVYYSYGRAKGTYTFVQRWEWSEAYQEYLPAGGEWKYTP